MSVLSYGLTNTGRKRKHNEDNFLIDRELKLYIVADGMGGHNAGEVASEYAIRIIRAEVLKNKNVLLKTIEREKAGKREDPMTAISLVEHSIQKACKDIFDMSQRADNKKGMGTTVVVLLIIGSRAIVAHVGDSRVYLIRNNMIHQLTEDHSMVQEQLKMGKITKEEAENSPFKNIITRAVGIYEYVPPDITFLDLSKGDRFLLCSDGVYPYFTDKEFIKYIANKNEELNTIAKKIEHTVMSKGAHDNLTVLLTEVEDLDKQETGSVSNKLDLLKRIPLFQYLSYQELVKTYGIISTRKYNEGELIITEGDIGEEFFILFKGKVAVLKGSVEVAQLYQGSNFGEMGLVDNAPRSASIKALETCYLMVVERAKFFEIMKKEPKIAVKLLWSLLKVFSSRLRSTTNELSKSKEDNKKLSDDNLFKE